MIETSEALRKSYYGNHGSGCLCAMCRDSRMEKRAGNNDGGEEGRKAQLQAMFHEGKAMEHQQMAFGPEAKKIPDDTRLKHMEAASLHNEAADHYRGARWAFRDGLPKGAREHLELAEAPAAKAKKLSAELGV
jgi:hypothetical protein